MHQKTRRNRITSVERALTLLQILAERGRISVSEAAAEIGVAASTAHRLLATLVHRRFAEQGPGRLYYPGPELQSRTGFPSGNQLIRVMRPFLEQVHAATDETLHLMIPVHADIRLIDGIESERRLKVSLRVGTLMPAYCGAGGKAMFADLDWSEVEQLHAGGLRPWPTAKIRDLKGLRREIQTTRQRGYGLNVAETEEGVSVIGVSIRARSGRPIAAMTVAMPSSRFNRACEAAYSKILLAARVAAERKIAQHD